MKTEAFFSGAILKALFLCVVLAALPAVGAEQAKLDASTKKLFAAATLGEIPKSTYSVPASMHQGRNPFFPNSPMTPVAEPQTTSQTNSPPPPSYDIVLNGITSPPRPTAMINGRTFEPGEEGEVKLPSGSKVHIRCDEIKEASAIVVVEGVRRELKLRFAL